MISVRIYSLFLQSVQGSMKPIKPYHVLIYLVGILAILSPLVYFTPEGGWQFGNDVNVKFLTAESFLHPKKQEIVDIDTIVSGVDTTVTDENILLHQNFTKGNLGAPSGGKVSVTSASELVYSEKGKANLQSFFETLSNVAASKNKISILHYGDSQIEGDRMTNYIRQRLQNQFGGYGPGLIASNNVYNTYSFQQSYSESFKRYICFSRKNNLVSKKYGTMGSASRFTDEYEEATVNLSKLKLKSGWIEIKPSRKGYARLKTFNNVVMHYTDCIAHTKVKVYSNEKLIHEDTLITDGNYHALTLTFETTPEKLRYEFEGKISPNICAFSLEGDYGVQVSNIAMRGSSGTVFGKISYESMKAMNAQLNTELVILQFGGNSVPFYKDSASVRKFAGYFRGQINTVKRLNPQAMVIVIGPSDMSDLVDGIRETYKYLPYCVDQLRKVSVETGSAYWDLYTAMGGKNSMAAWVEKGFAGKDFIHFSNAGAKIASQLFYESLIAEYLSWKETK